jgi:hypothetical protein
MHLFFECPFNTACWNFVGIHRNFELPLLGYGVTSSKK